MLENGWKNKWTNLSKRALKLCRKIKKSWTLLVAEESIQYPARVWPCTQRGSAWKANAVVQCTHWCLLMPDFQSRAVQFLKAPFVRGRILQKGWSTKSWEPSAIIVLFKIFSKPEGLKGFLDFFNRANFQMLAGPGDFSTDYPIG